MEFDDHIEICKKHIAKLIDDAGKSGLTGKIIQDSIAESKKEIDRLWKKLDIIYLYSWLKGYDPRTVDFYEIIKGESLITTQGPHNALHVARLYKLIEEYIDEYNV